MPKMKVVQCWDDGVLTDIRLTEILRKYGAKATFNLNIGFHTEEPGRMFWNRDPHRAGHNHLGFCCGKIGLKDLKSVYDGFQVASHCWLHENAGWIPDAKFVESAMASRKYLEDLFQHECRGFAWPCGRFTPETCRLMHEAGFAYGRTTLNTEDVTDCADTMALATNCHFQNWEFYRKYEAAKATGVFYFWGHSYETLDYEQLWLQLEDKIRYITEDPESEWADVIDIVPLCHKK